MMIYFFRILLSIKTKICAKFAEHYHLLVYKMFFQDQNFGQSKFLYLQLNIFMCDNTFLSLSFFCRSSPDTTPSKYVREYIEKILMPVFSQLSSFSNHVQQSVGRLAVKVKDCTFKQKYLKKNTKKILATDCG